MRSAVNSLASWCVACAIAATPAAPAAADEQEGFWGWVPSFAVTGGVLMQHQHAGVRSNCERGEPAQAGNPKSENCLFQSPPQRPAPLRPAATGSQWVVTPSVGLDVQLMAPAIPRIPGRPRLFAWGEVDFAYGPKRNVANEGDPTGIALPGNKGSLSEASTGSLQGVGSRTASVVQRHVWGAGAGIAFPFRFRGRQFWLKPAAAWTRYGLDIEGTVLSGLKNDRPDATTVYGSYMRVVSLIDQRSEIYDGIGPALDIEMDVGKFGPIGASLFIGAGAYKILGDRSLSFDKTFVANFFTPALNITPSPPWRLGPDTYNASWTYEIDPWLYRSWVGLRLSWLGN